MYCSIDKIDLAARVDGKPVAVQTDHRRGAEIEAEPELSVLFAMARVLNARSHLHDSGHHDAIVHYALNDDAPPLLREALGAVGGALERGKRVESLGAANEMLAGELADRSFSALALRVKSRVGSRDVAIALRMLEDQTFADPPRRDDEPAYWQRVLELAALAGELLRAKYPGRWVQTDRALVPFGFQVQSGAAVMFPTNRAQRVIEDGPDESLFKLLLAAEETVQRPADATTGRLMPSLRHRGDIELDEVVWRPIVDDQGPLDLPVVVCGIDGESTFGMIRREAMAKTVDAAFDEALFNLGDEAVQCEEIEIAGLTVIMVSGNFYAAEKILDREFMQSLHHALDSDLLAASTPARGCLLVTANYHDNASLARFSAIAHARHEDGGGRAISPAVLLVERGRVAGYVRGPTDPPPRPDTATTRAETSPQSPKRVGLLRRLLGRK
ncbi:MAG TPA: hypothetical protein VIV11_04550 [Kofleriaceae bacterium]